MNVLPKISFIKPNHSELEFEITKLKNLFSRREKLNFRIDRPHRVAFYHILYLTKGSGMHHIDFRPYKYSRGSILFISKGQVHAFEINSDSDGFLILFTELFLTKNLIHSDFLSFYRLYNYHLQQPILQPQEGGKDNFGNIIGEMYEEYVHSNDFAKEDMLQLLLKLLLLKAERIQRTLTLQGKNSDWFIKYGEFKSLIEQHFAETRNAKDYARMMNISYKHLNQICKSMTGKTAKKSIDSFVTLEIKRHLAMSGMSLQELSYELGFDEPTNFVKFFKRQTGYSPSKFGHLLKK